MCVCVNRDRELMHTSNAGGFITVIYGKRDGLSDRRISEPQRGKNGEGGRGGGREGKPGGLGDEAQYRGMTQFCLGMGI